MGDGKLQQFLKEWLGDNWYTILTSWRTSVLGGISLVLFYITMNPQALEIFPEHLRHIIWNAADFMKWATAAGYVLITQDIFSNKSKKDSDKSSGEGI